MEAPSADVTLSMWTRSCNYRQMSSNYVNRELFQKYLIHNMGDKTLGCFASVKIGRSLYFFIWVYDSRGLPAFYQSTF